MVRVISVHHFASQHIQTVEQPTACAVATPNRLLLALTSNCVEVRDLNNESDVLFSFPTVDEVVQIVHCIHGDYVATLETKFNRQNKETNFVRVYINWDSIATLQQSKMTSSGVSLGSSECGMVQPMRARIAGRVTPTTNQSELGNLEMIEVPVKRNPSFMECCQVSGNLVILSNNIINIYAFEIRTHDISKMRFVDFNELPFIIELTFKPKKILFCENYIACMNSDTMHMFKINATNNKEANNILSNTDFEFLYSSNGTIDYQKLIQNELLNNNKEKITINLPSILKDNSAIHKNNPFTFCDKDLVATVKSNSAMESISQSYKTENLIQLKLVPILIENAQRKITEEFKCMLLKPLYIDESLNKSECDSRFLKSDYKKCLNSVVCMVATQQEGYLYQFNDGGIGNDKDNCIALYPFTAPVYQLVMEDYFLHALTETGLESYSLRFGHQLCRNFETIDNVNVACPSINDSICLVGLRPFLGVERILLAENHLVLLANSDSSPTHSISSNSSSNTALWTLYNLELPTPKTIFNDISIVANIHRFSSAQTYCHLLSEAHMILRMALVLKKWTMTEDSVKLIIPLKNNIEDIVETYRVSCALLGDHYIMCTAEEDFILALPYYKMARVMPAEVVKRIKKVQEQANTQATKGLIHYLKSTLLEIKSSIDVDRLFGSGSKQNFSETILDLFEKQSYEDLPHLILKSIILREYSTDKLIQILNEKITEYSKTPEKFLALAILYLHKCNLNKAEECLNKISKDFLFHLLLENWELLFEKTTSLQSKSKGVTTFSELAVLLISLNPELLAEVFVILMVDKKVVNLSKIIKVFLEYLPSSIGSDSNSASIVLQKTLELYFQQYFSKPENFDLTKITYERGASEAMKLLVRSYLSQLQILQMREECTRKERNKNTSNKIDDYFDEEDDTEKDKHQEKFGYNRMNKSYFEETVKQPIDAYLFASLRYEYLNKMPPFQIEVTSKLYQTCVDNYVVKEDFSSNEEADLVLKKLQALLCSLVLPKQVLAEINAFLSVNETLRGNFSLQSIILSTNDAILLLIDACPQCLLYFGKDRFNRTDEWKFLIATIQRRILKLSQNEKLKRICFFHKKILKDILSYVAASMTLDQLVLVLPQRFSTTSSELSKADSLTTTEIGYSETDLDILNEIQNYDPYVVICKETMHASQINKLITTTGQQLLCNLNL